MVRTNTLFNFKHPFLKTFQNGEICLKPRDKSKSLLTKPLPWKSEKTQSKSSILTKYYKRNPTQTPATFPMAVPCEHTNLPSLQEKETRNKDISICALPPDLKPLLQQCRSFFCRVCIWRRYSVGNCLILRDKKQQKSFVFILDGIDCLYHIAWGSVDVSCMTVGGCNKATFLIFDLINLAMNYIFHSGKSLLLALFVIIVYN